MRRLLSLLRSRRGETLVEVLMSLVLFLIIMGVLSSAMGFAAGAQAKAEALQKNAELVQQNLRTGGDKVTREPDGQETFEFRAISKDGSAVGSTVIFRVETDRYKVTVEGGEDMADSVFYLFQSPLPEDAP